jgi:hypothetical protein
MTNELEDAGMDFDDVSETLEDERDETLTEKAKEFGEDVYDFASEAVGPSTAVTVPVGAGAAALTNQPIEVGAGAGVSASLLYEAAKHHKETGRDMDLEDGAFLGGLTAMGPAGGYAASKRDEIAEYAGEGLDAAVDAGQSAYQTAVGAGADAANYVMAEGPQLANEAAASAGDAAVGVGAGLATIMGGAIAYGKAKQKLTEDRDWEVDEEY